MNLSRKSFFQALTATFALPWLGIEPLRSKFDVRRARPIPPSAWLREWMRRPRIPVLKSADPKAGWLTLRGGTVEFRYDGGSEPGEARRVSPALVFHLQDSQALYLAGYCHRRQQERVFRVDKIQPAVEMPG